MSRKNGLDGLTGVVLLMFTGRETYTAEFSEELKPRFYHNIENVDQAVARLSKEGYLLNKSRDVIERGAPKYRTASHDALKMQLNLIEKSGGGVFTEQLLKDLSVIAPHFPEYLALSIGAEKVAKLPWNIIFGNYLTFGLQVLGLLMSQGKMNDAKDLDMLTPAIKVVKTIDTEKSRALISRYDLKDVDKLTRASMVLMLGKNGPLMFKQVAKLFGSDSSIL